MILDEENRVVLDEANENAITRELNRKADRALWRGVRVYGVDIKQPPQPKRKAKKAA